MSSLVPKRSSTCAKFRFAAVVLPFAAAGCATVPDLGPSPVIRSAETAATAQTFAQADGRWPGDRWWTDFADSQLDGLIDEALRSSPDIATAAARLRRAEALIEETRAAGQPQLSAEAEPGAIRNSRNFGVPPQFVPKNVANTGRLTAVFSFDLDLWGKNRAALRAATSDAVAARVDVAEARLLLTTAIASTYARLANLFAERDVAEGALAVRRTAVELTTQRLEAGLDTTGELRQAQYRVPLAAADLKQIDEQILVTRHQLAFLLGAGPDRGLAIQRPALQNTDAELPVRVGLDLVGRRPDIVAARLRTESAAERVKVARRSFYPDINIAGLVGLQSFGIGNLFEMNSAYGSGGAAISLPIFDGGRLRGQYRGARADFDLAVAQYDATLLLAVRQVADAIGSIRMLESQLAERRQALGLAQDASRIARLRYRGGLSNQLTVLTTDDDVLQVQREVADLEARRVALRIDLFSALGGGFQEGNERADGGE